MGLPAPALRFLIREHKRRPFSGPILTLGRQGVLATPEEARDILVSEQVPPAGLAPDEDTGTNIPSWSGTWNERFISDLAFFQLLGVHDVSALDCSNYEKVDFVFDLNLPIPEELKNRFSLVLDGGTLEHIFDIKQALTNIGLMLRPGGRIIHMLPANNSVNHGFYQFSPTLFFDYYGANAYADLRGFIADETRYLNSWEMYEVPAQRYARLNQMISTTPLHFIFIADKTSESTVGNIPAQGRYAHDHVQPDTGSFRLPSAGKARLKSLVPNRVEIFLRRYVLAYDPANRLPRWLRILMLRFLPGFDKNKDAWQRQLKPWGLQFRGRLD